MKLKTTFFAGIAALAMAAPAPLREGGRAMTRQELGGFRPGREGRGARAKSDTSACLAFNVVQLGAARAEHLRSEVGRGGDSIVQGNRDMCS